MKITTEMVDYISVLSRLKLPEEEKEKMTGELEQIIAGRTGKQVKVKMILQADEHVEKAQLAQIQVEDALENLIHADIEIED